MTLPLNRIFLYKVLIFNGNLVIFLYRDLKFPILQLWTHRCFQLCLMSRLSKISFITFRVHSLLDLNWLSIKFSLYVPYSLNFTSSALKWLLRHRIWLACLVWWILLADWLQFLTVFLKKLLVYVFTNFDWLTTHSILIANDFHGKAKIAV